MVVSLPLFILMNYICINYCNIAMSSVMYPARKEIVDDSGFLRTPDRPPELCGLCVL